MTAETFSESWLSERDERALRRLLHAVLRLLDEVDAQGPVNAEVRW